MGTFTRAQQKQMDRAPGIDGRVILICDRSRSMHGTALAELSMLAPKFKRAIAGLRLFAFHYSYAEVDPREHTILSVPLDDGESKSNGTYTNRTRLADCLRTAAEFQPQNTIVMSDGAVIDADECLNIADAMTGTIDAYYCWSIYENPEFMRKLARRGRGKFVEVGVRGKDLRQQLTRSLTKSRFREDYPMARERLPDKSLDDFVDELDFHAPEKKIVDVREEVEVWTGTVVKQVHKGIEWAQAEGVAQSQSISAPGSHATIQQSDQVQRVERKGFIGWLTSAPAAPQIAAPRSQDRGNAIPVDFETVRPQRAALAPPRQAPQPSTFALPAPSREGHALPPSEHRPGQFRLDHKAELPADMAGRVASKFKIG